MYRSLRSNSDSVFSVLEAGDDFEFLENTPAGHYVQDGVFPDLVDVEDERLLCSRRSTVVGGDYRLHPEQDLGNVNLTRPGRCRDNIAKVKDTWPNYHHLYAECKQDLDFTNFEAHIRRTSSSQDLTEENSEDSDSSSMAPVITVTQQMSPPGHHAFILRNLPPDMLSRSKKTRGFAHSSGLSTPTGSMTPTGMQTPSGMRTPSGARTPSTFSVLKRSSSSANLIHYHTLESVNVSELYTQQSIEDEAQHPNDGSHPLNANLNISPDLEFSKSDSRFTYRSTTNKYKSHSCPHSRRHSPPRLRHRIETVNETDGSLPDIVTASGGSNGSVDLKDINFNDMDDIQIINQVDDNLTGGHMVESDLLGQDGSYSRHRSASLSFASLFSRCRYERDTSVPNTPCEGDNHVVDPEQLMNRVNFFLCAERVSQMTKTYNDIDAVTRLLEEKERDLELAARIGQTLLSKNKELGARTDALEDELSAATEKVKQLSHENIKKEDLLRSFNVDLEHETSGEITPISGSLVNVDFLEKKVKTLEEENFSLRSESEQLKSDTDNLEEKEKRLVEDCIQQLADVNNQVESLAEELHLKVEENAVHKEEIKSLLAHITDLQKKIRKLTNENKDIYEKLTMSAETQRKLTKELGCMQDKYDELNEMLEEAQDELKLMRGKNKVRSSGQHHHSAYSVPTDSLASELETSLQQELSQPRRRSYNWKVFETARAAKRAVTDAAQRDKSSVPRRSLVPPMLRESDSQATSAYPSDVESLASDGYSADMDSLYGSNPELGQPGVPGTDDLASALKKLAMRRANEQSEKDFHEEEEERRRKKLQAAMSGGTSPFSVRSPNPYALRSPAGSLTPSHWSSSGLPLNNHHFKISEKLQIVKPLEGSMTLRHWQHLATPHLGGIFEERDGVQIKGEKKLDLVEEIYSLSDFEEDDDPHYIHTRREQDMALTYTFTDSTVDSPGSYRGQGSLFGTSTPVSIHGNTLPGSDLISVMGSGSQHIQFGQQRSGSDDDSQSTHNMSLGLASLLQGRENTDVGRAVMRGSTGTSTASTNEASGSTTPVSKSDFNQMILSSRSFGGHPHPSSALRHIPGSRSFAQAMTEYEEKRKASETTSTKKPELFAPGMTGKGFLQQLKSKGYSLYGLWGGGGKDNQASTEKSVDGATGGGDGVKATNESVFSNGAGVGVLGALTNFRRNGMF